MPSIFKTKFCLAMLKKQKKSNESLLNNKFVNLCINSYSVLGGTINSIKQNHKFLVVRYVTITCFWVLDFSVKKSLYCQHMNEQQINLQFARWI